MVIYRYIKEIFNMETYATVKGQIVIPATLRRKYGIKNGTKIIVTDNGDSISLKPVTEQYLKNLQGSLKGKGALKVLVSERSKDKERE
jgi:AbrB family looped-hinge helix DNA binding protein